MLRADNSLIHFVRNGSDKPGPEDLPGKGVMLPKAGNGTADDQSQHSVGAAADGG